MSEIETPPLQQHPKVWDPATLVLLVILCVFGAIIGVQLLVSLGVTPNTAIIGAMAAMIVARVPLKFFGHYRSVHVQNLAQSATSAATFGAANSLLLPIAIPWLFGRPDMVVPMFIGVALAMLLDGFLLYKLFIPGYRCLAARKLAHQGAEVIVLDCMGYSKTLRDICAEAVDVPVIASSTMVAELTANLL